VAGGDLPTPLPGPPRGAHPAHLASLARFPSRVACNWGGGDARRPVLFGQPTAINHQPPAADAAADAQPQLHCLGCHMAGDKVPLGRFVSIHLRDLVQQLLRPWLAQEPRSPPHWPNAKWPKASAPPPLYRRALPSAERELPWPAALLAKPAVELPLCAFMRGGAWRLVTNAQRAQARAPPIRLFACLVAGHCSPGLRGSGLSRAAHAVVGIGIT
jgi:hypothetical protein